MLILGEEGDRCSGGGKSHAVMELLGGGRLLPTNATIADVAPG